MLESQPSQIQSLWLSGLAARQGLVPNPASPSAPRAQGPGTLVSCLRALANLAKALASHFRKAPDGPRTASPCCPAPSCC